MASKKRPGHILTPEERRELQRQRLRERHENAVKRKRSEAAKKGWATRRAREAAERELAERQSKKRKKKTGQKKASKRPRPSKKKKQPGKKRPKQPRQPSRSQAAIKGWETRRAKELEEKKERVRKAYTRSLAARKGWETRRRNTALQTALETKMVVPRSPFVTETMFKVWGELTAGQIVTMNEVLAGRMDMLDALAARVMPIEELVSEFTDLQMEYMKQLEDILGEEWQEADETIILDRMYKADQLNMAAREADDLAEELDWDAHDVWTLYIQSMYPPEG